VTRELVCEPAEAKQRPDSSYAAQFSLPYGMAACLTRRRFGLQEIEKPVYSDAQLLALAKKVRYAIDPKAGFPRTRTGEVIVTLKNGTTLRERDEINPDEPATADAIVQKFFENAELAIGRSRAERVRDAVLTLDAQRDVSALTQLLGNRSVEEA
jgi:2-methylcitrate dehydratase PrpD